MSRYVRIYSSNHNGILCICAEYIHRKKGHRTTVKTELTLKVSKTGLCSQGFHGSRAKKCNSLWVIFCSHQPSVESLKILLALAGQHDLAVLSADVSTTFYGISSPKGDPIDSSTSCGHLWCQRQFFISGAGQGSQRAAACSPGIGLAL